MRHWYRGKGRCGPRSIEECEAAIEKQDGRCAICGEKADRLFDDHDHSTGLPRDMLCRVCNLLLGYAKDDAKILASAIKYLERHRVDNPA